jgi:hypothetical protein
MTDHRTDRLSAYLDNELTPAGRADVESHLSSCRDCADTLDELREVVERGRALPPRPAAPPDNDLWPGIAARLERPAAVMPFVPRAATRRFSFTVPQLVAAGLALMVMSGGGVWVLQHGGRATALPQLAAADPTIVPVSLADPRYDEAIADLEQTLNAGRADLDPGTIRILESNLAAIDTAIDQSRQALAADPANVYLNNHLADSRQRKLALLRRATAMVNKG